MSYIKEEEMLDEHPNIEKYNIEKLIYYVTCVKFDFYIKNRKHLEPNLFPGFGENFFFEEFGDACYFLYVNYYNESHEDGIPIALNKFGDYMDYENMRDTYHHGCQSGCVSGYIYYSEIEEMLKAGGMKYYFNLLDTYMEYMQDMDADYFKKKFETNSQMVYDLLDFSVEHLVQQIIEPKAEAIQEEDNKNELILEYLTDFRLWLYDTVFKSSFDDPTIDKVITRVCERSMDE